MCPRTSEQFDQIRQEKKILIMDVALELFAENGYHATSMSQIANKAGISKGLAYNYFDSKKAILEEIIHTGFTTIYANLDLNHDGTLTEEEFILFIRHTFSIMRANLRYWKLYFSLLLRPHVNESFNDEYSKNVQSVMSMLYDFLVRKGSKDPEGDLMVLSALFEGASLMVIVAPELFPAEIMEEKIIDAIERFIHLENNATSKS